MKKLEIITFYFMFVSIATAFWTVVFKLVCPKFLICGVIVVSVIATIISALLSIKCFIELENKEAEKVFIGN